MPRSYHVNTRDRSFVTRSARSAASVARAWKRAGWDVGLYVVSDGRVQEVPITTVEETASRAAKATWD